MTVPQTITVKTTDVDLVQGEKVWHNQRDGRACVRVNSGKLVVGDYVDSLFGDDDENLYYRLST